VEQGMTINTTTNRVSYDGDGSTIEFTVPFAFFGPDELEVFERVILTGAETTKLLTSDYTVADGGGGTGMVTAMVPPASTVSWTIIRNTKRSQEIDYTDNDPFPAETHESGLDRATMIAQDSIADTDRAIKFAKTDAGTLVPTLPSSVERANRFLAFDANGNPIAASGPSGDSSIPVSAYAETLLDDMDAATARGTLGLVIGVDVAPFGAEQAVVPIGAVTQWLGATSPSNWLMLNGDTMGSDASAATQRSDSYETLFTLIWNSIANAQTPVPGGRGVNASADWVAGKSITLPDIRGRSIIGSGTGTSLTARTHGDSGGAETHTLTIAEMPEHNHNYSTRLTTLGVSGSGTPVNQGATTLQTSLTGGDGAHNNMQPWLALNFIVRAA
jgi:hypothetical protein